jgi:hypothetical protein
MNNRHLQEALFALVAAMEAAERAGCVDHLDVAGLSEQWHGS